MSYRDRKLTRAVISVSESSPSCDTTTVVSNLQLSKLCQPSIIVYRYRWFDDHSIRQSWYIASRGRSVEGKWGRCTMLPMITFMCTLLPMIDLGVLYFPWSDNWYSFWMAIFNIWIRISVTVSLTSKTISWGNETHYRATHLNHPLDRNIYTGMNSQMLYDGTFWFFLN